MNGCFLFASTCSGKQARPTSRRQGAEGMIRLWEEFCAHLSPALITHKDHYQPPHALEVVRRPDVRRGFLVTRLSLYPLETSAPRLQRVRRVPPSQYHQEIDSNVHREMISNQRQVTPGPTLVVCGRKRLACLRAVRIVTYGTRCMTLGGRHRTPEEPRG